MLMGTFLLSIFLLEGWDGMGCDGGHVSEVK